VSTIGADSVADDRFGPNWGIVEMSTDLATGAAPVPDVSPAFEHQRSGLARVQHLLHKYPIVSPLVVLLASVVAFIIFSDGLFQQPASIGTMLQATAVMATLAVGQTLIILTAGVDLAVGTAMLLAHLLVAKLVAVNGAPPIVALAAGIVAGMLMGFLHGTVVSRIGLPPFIVTLGTFYVYQSLGLVYSNAQTFDKAKLGGKDGLLLFAGRELKLGSLTITVGVLVALVLYVIFSYVLANTAWGRHVYATGDDAEAARLAGVDTRKVLLSVYVVAGLIYGIGAWVQIGRAGNASINGAADVNLASITAVVIGGTSLFGGRGRLWGTLIGALIVATFDRGLSLAVDNQYWKNFAIGLLILVAVGLDQWIRKVGK
jgi:fructose transport system permease protein